MSHTIALLSKYPPLEGGIAAKTYWLARGLAARGHDVHVIADRASEGGEYRIKGYCDAVDASASFHIHRPKETIPWHIPEDNERTSALLDLTLKVIRQYRVEIIDTGYLVPYGIVGSLARRITGVHHVLRHGGSDLGKFLKNDILGTLLVETIAGASAVVSNECCGGLLEPFNGCIYRQPAYVPNENTFTSRAGRKSRLAAIGKINYHWHHKSLHQIALIMYRLSEEFECSVIGQGNGLQNFQASLGHEIASRLRWHPFVPPYEMPGLLSQLDAVFVFEKNLPHPVVSNLALEAMIAGTGVITDHPDFADAYRDVIDVRQNEVLFVTASDPSLAAEEIMTWTLHRSRERSPAVQLVRFERYLDLNEAIYDRLLDSH